MPLGAPLASLGRATSDGVEGIGQLTRLAATSFSRALRRPVRASALTDQLLQMGAGSLSLTVTVSLFAGMVLAFQFGVGLERFGAKLYIGQTTVYALFRELGPLLTALVVGGRIGAGMAAELGGMAVTEQLDAMRALGADPLQRLVAPRIAASMLAMPLLCVTSDIVGFLGGMIIASTEYGVSPGLYFRGVVDFITLGDFGSGLFKTVIFGFIIGAVGCQQGMTAQGGTEGVGRATTRAVVVSALCVLGGDFLLTKMLLTI